MTFFFEVTENHFIAIDSNISLSNSTIEKLSWLFNSAKYVPSEKIEGRFTGPRKEMITPWSTNAVEITQNMGIEGIVRMEEYFRLQSENDEFDPMLQALYKNLDQEIFVINRLPEPVLEIDNIAKYNEQEGLALNEAEIDYLNNLSIRLNRKLTDSEVFGFSQVNSEHCRHKIFNGLFIIDGVEKESSLFQLIKKTTKTNPNKVVSAYKDNCSFVQGPKVQQFAPLRHDIADYFETKEVETVLSLKAETHNFPTTVEPFNGAATGTGGEIRDRIAGGKGAVPSVGTAVYMTSYPRSEGPRAWEKNIAERKWLYQTPEEILIKASNGASDFGNKFGQALICGSLFTFEHQENSKKFAYDKVIMQAGGIGYGRKQDSQKDIPEKGDVVVLLGGDNYRIGMGGGAVSSVATGEYANKIELNAVQRANPEMQKRVFNAIRALTESGHNSIISIHDHGAGGHLNCLSELVEATGGRINMDSLPIGDQTLSAKEIVGNESQERMGLVMSKKYVEEFRKIAERERAPIYIIGEVTGDHRFSFKSEKTGEKPIDLELADMFGSPPLTILKDETLITKYKEPEYEISKFETYLSQVLQLEAVASKDWLTNKVDRSVSGRIAKQQCAGELQLPLNNLGVMTLDYLGIKGYATSIGHAPAAALIDPAAGSVLAISEALTNIIWAPLADKIKSVSLSANWMWPCKNPGEDARLYKAAQAASDFAIALGINIPTGKDSLSMTQKYADEVVYSPGTVIISAAAEVTDVRKVVEPVLKLKEDSLIIYIDFSEMPHSIGGSSFAQTLNRLGTSSPSVKDPKYFVKAFNAVQDLITNEKILAGHDISSGGIITCLLEMCFPVKNAGMNIDISNLDMEDPVKFLFAENPGIIIQVENESCLKSLKQEAIAYMVLGKVKKSGEIELKTSWTKTLLSISELRKTWFKSSYLLDRKQSGAEKALERYQNLGEQPLSYDFGGFTGSYESYKINPFRKEKTGVKVAIIREKGVNGDREMAYALHLSGMDVKDVHMTDLISGREDLSDVNMIVFVGGFSNSDVLGSAKGWAGAFKYNEKARIALENFYKREDTLSLGVCNGCQLMVELELIDPNKGNTSQMLHNESGKFESSFLNVDIRENDSVMLKSLSGKKLGIWVAHGEGKFHLPEDENQYNIPMKYSFDSYPGNPNGSDYSAAAICSSDGRHLAMMPHLERAFMPYQCAHYPESRKDDDVTPWIEAFVNAREWIKAKINS
ncbi:MAG: phosphoribosylformylglycinamidine synthase [Bacteroidales bacterium]|nr:phosphoribosylformylglycinamidine synthase [Bacteroidales bacterium]MCF8391007.1 phosphoribosylformylglycinamidine synthase [Bacteroidales bacterium]